MSLKKPHLFLITWIFILSFSTKAALPDCRNIQNTLELYDCTLSLHPQFNASKLTAKAAEAAYEKASQLPNPELEVKSVAGKNAGENIGGTELTLTVSLSDLLVKRSALNALGKSEEKLMLIDAQEKEFLVKAGIIKDIFRYRQVIEEMDLIVEALAAFRQIENQFKARRARGPEQEITLNLVQLAQGDYELRKNHLFVEKNEIETRFKGHYGLNFQLNKKWLPAPKVVWPKIEASGISKKTFELRKLEAEKEKLSGEKSLAVAESWPQMTAGPVVERTTEGPSSFYSYGFRLNIELPIFSINSGARHLADKTLLVAQMAADYANKKSTLEQDLLVQKYISAVESLKNSPSAESLKKKHAQIDRLFTQGLTSGATIIEAHRQIVAFEESQHEHEMVAIESLMLINTLSGKDVNEVLK
jgi:outer membrane protein TolC